jgi:preprotein translocase subunit Sss1
MQVNYGAEEIKKLLSKIKIFNNQIGTYKLFSVNESFTYFVMLTNGKIIISMDDLIASEEETITEHQLKEIAGSFVSNDNSLSSTLDKKEVPIKKEKLNSKLKRPISNFFKFLRIFLIVILLLGLAGYIIIQKYPYLFKREVALYEIHKFNENVAEINQSENAAKPKTELQLKQELYRKEKANPTKYIDGEIKNRKNLVGLRVFEGDLSNTATLIGVKNITLKIEALAKTGYVLESRNYVITEFIDPQATTSFKLKTDEWDLDTDKFKYTIMKAETY